MHIAASLMTVMARSFYAAISVPTNVRVRWWCGPPGGGGGVTWQPSPRGWWGTAFPGVGNDKGGGVLRKHLLMPPIFPFNRRAMAELPLDVPISLPADWEECGVLEFVVDDSLGAISNAVNQPLLATKDHTMFCRPT